MIQTIIVGHLAVAAFYDVRYRKVPNAVVLSLGFLGIVYQVMVGRGMHAVTGIVCAFLVTLLPAMFRGMGMGDQKLLMAVGSWMGGSDVYQLFLLSLCLSILIMFLYPRRWVLLSQNLYCVYIGWFAHKQLWLPSVRGSALSQPFAVAIFASYCIFLLGDSL